MRAIKAESPQQPTVSGAKTGEAYATGTEYPISWVMGGRHSAHNIIRGKKQRRRNVILRR
jgi:hypothetical protein